MKPSHVYLLLVVLVVVLLCCFFISTCCAATTVGAIALSDDSKKPGSKTDNNTNATTNTNTTNTTNTNTTNTTATVQHQNPKGSKFTVTEAMLKPLRSVMSDRYIKESSKGYIPLSQYIDLINKDYKVNPDYPHPIHSKYKATVVLVSSCDQKVSSSVQQVKDHLKNINEQLYKASNEHVSYDFEYWAETVQGGCKGDQNGCDLYGWGSSANEKLGGSSRDIVIAIVWGKHPLCGGASGVGVMGHCHGDPNCIASGFAQNTSLPSVKTIIHEIGHCLGMRHSSSSKVPFGDWTKSDYGDRFCVMGNGSFISLDACWNATQLWFSGWLDEPEFVDVASIPSSAASKFTLPVNYKHGLLLCTEKVPIITNNRTQTQHTDSIRYPYIIISLRRHNNATYVVIHNCERARTYSCPRLLGYLSALNSSLVLPPPNMQNGYSVDNPLEEYEKINVTDIVTNQINVIMKNDMSIHPLCNRKLLLKVVNVSSSSAEISLQEDK